MKLGYNELRDRIAGCWQGKNAGGALGAPLECKRGSVDVEWYMQPDIDPVSYTHLTLPTTAYV